ncbi:MAG: hypothetical protein K0U93_26550 [Gammaproteobacteria bacterium]|nr:hypothetical protein [Gammaproteobacteria bacterium]
MPADVTQWRLTHGAKLHWQELDSRLLAYDEGSGHTFLADETTRQILESVGERPKTCQQIIDGMPNVNGFTSDNISTVLKELAAAHLVARVHMSEAL